MKYLLVFLLTVLGWVDLNAQSFRARFTEANLLMEDGYDRMAIPI